MFYRVKSVIIDQDNGAMVASCSQCKTELEMPTVEMPRKVRKTKNATHQVSHTA